MSFAKAYEPAQYEPDIYQLWERSGAFAPDPHATKESFTIILPPPNANGHIHVGTAMFTIEDIMIRFRRMQGHRTLWLPGTDHAGIETQVVFERELAKEGKSRFDLGREEFYRRVMAFTEANRSTILSELKSMGFSLDWSRLKFTLDSDIIEIVYDTFKRLNAAGHVYRGNRIVNWCPTCRSAFADIEIKYREQLDPLYYIKYGPFVLATVRPETKFGDTAIAVNPGDDRYTQYVDQTIAAADLLGPIELKVIADDHVNPEFGTGAVKVTPAHDPNDWEMGQRHNLEVRPVIGTDGLLMATAGKYAGMPVMEARVQVAHDLEEHGLIDHVDMNYTHSVGYHDRCGTLIEPLVIEQWWLKVAELKQPAIAAIKSGQIKFVPERFTATALQWLEDLHDWNIGRQNWWGIRIPVYYNSSADHTKPEYIIGSEAEAIATYGEGNFEAETDNFDTWFSSGQWPFATLMASGDFEAGYYPTSVMETGRDILFLWVTRMIMLGLFRTGQIPFRTVYLHGLVNDEQGQKMSKSRGNVINPLELTAQYGTDALRLALTIGITPGNDGTLSAAKVAGYRNFCNKLWNVARYVAGRVGESAVGEPEAHNAADHWILARLHDATKQVTTAIEGYRFSEAGQAVYDLLWNDWADWYIEAAKVEENINLLASGLTNILKLAHPFVPFVTEAIWQQLPWVDGNLITTPWPVVAQAGIDRAGAVEFAQLQTLIEAARSGTVGLGLQRPRLQVKSVAGLEENRKLIQSLARLSQIEITEAGSGLRLVTPHYDAWLEADATTIQRYRHQLTADLTEQRDYLQSLERQLANRAFIAAAPQPVIADVQRRHDEAKLVVSKLDEQLQALT